MQPAKIMICEDEALIALELEQKLIEFGYSVTGIAADEHEALALAARDRPDVALMDIRLRGALSGPEIAAILGEKYDIPSIYLSAYTDADTVSKASLTEPLGYLVKPVRDSDLDLSIRFGLAQHHAKKKLRDRVLRNREKLDRAQAVLSDITSNLSREIRMTGLQDLIGGIAHYFNNSLMSISGYLEFLEHAGGLQPFQIRQIQPVIKIYNEQKDFVQRLLWTSGHASFNRSFHKVKDILDGAVQQIEPLLKPKIKFTHRYQKCTYTAMLDKEAMIQAIANLLRNAVEAVGEAGFVSLQIDESFEEMPERFNSQAVPGKYSLITIQDSGPGISPPLLPKVFEPFFSTRLERLAPGLGLSESYGILQEHGGWIELTSEADAGTTAQIFIPIGESTNATQQ